MKVDLLYGREGITVDFPDHAQLTVVRKHPMPILPKPLQAVFEALDSPVGSPPLSDMARGKKTACILICDVTRPVPNGTILPPVVETLLDAGVPRDGIGILVATGLHRPNEGDELREIVGSDWVFRSIRAENHFARDKDAHVELGRTSRGFPVALDRRFVEADLKIVTGLVEPHFMAGYSGGRKVVAPGVAYLNTILSFHTTHILGHPNAANCVLDCNPLHEEQMEIVRTVGDILAVNVVIDENRRMGFVNFGDIEASHLEAVAFMRRYAEVSVSRRFRTIVTTSAGYPLDKTYYQTVKGMVGILDILEPGGTVIIAGECSEGMGSKEFVQAQRALCEMGPDRFMSMLETRDKALIDEWQTEMLIKALRKGNIQIYTTGLSPEDLNDIYVQPVRSVEEAVEASIRDKGDADVVVVPEGPYVIPQFDGS